MEVVFALVCGKGHPLPVQFEACAADAVGAAAHHRAQVRAVALVAPDVIAAQAHIHAVHNEGHQSRAIAGDLRPDPTVFDGVQTDLTTIGKFPKVFFHGFQSPFDFEELHLLFAFIIYDIGTNSNSILHASALFSRAPRSVWRKNGSGQSAQSVQHYIL